MPIAMTTMAISNSTRVSPLSLDASRRNAFLASDDAECRLRDVDAGLVGPGHLLVARQRLVDAADAVEPRARRNGEHRGSGRSSDMPDGPPRVRLVAPLHVVGDGRRRSFPRDERRPVERGVAGRAHQQTSSGRQPDRPRQRLRVDALLPERNDALPSCRSPVLRKRPLASVLRELGLVVLDFPTLGEYDLYRNDGEVVTATVVPVAIPKIDLCQRWSRGCGGRGG